VCSICTDSSWFGSRPSSLRIVGAICCFDGRVVAAGIGNRDAADDERHVAIGGIVAAVLGDLRLLAGVDRTDLRDAEQVGCAGVPGRDPEVRGGRGTGIRRAQPGGGVRLRVAIDFVAHPVVVEEVVLSPAWPRAR
jgi:hypothetical protein